jgi:hypothetical protein
MIEGHFVFCNVSIFPALHRQQISPGLVVVQPGRIQSVLLANEFLVPSLNDRLQLEIFLPVLQHRNGRSSLAVREIRCKWGLVTMMYLVALVIFQIMLFTFYSHENKKHPSPSTHRHRQCGCTITAFLWVNPDCHARCCKGGYDCT